MDQREPPRISPAEGRLRDPIDVPRADDPLGGRATRRRFAQFVPEPSAVRRVSPRRLTLIALGLLGAGLTIAWLVRGVIAYEHGQPAHQVPYQNIELDPAPPDWFVGGKAAFLDGVWGPTDEPRVLSALDYDLEHLRTLFRRNAWVRKVGPARLFGYPNRISVALEYREPVATDRNLRALGLAVDAEGVLVPSADVDPARLAELPMLHGFGSPVEPKPGEIWNQADPRTHTQRPDPRITAAAALAGFLKPRLRELSTLFPSKTYVFVLPPANFDLAGLYLQITCTEDRLIHWHDPTNPVTSRLSESEKWAMVLDWTKRNPPGPVKTTVHLRFSSRGLVLDSDLTARGATPATSLRVPRPGDSPARR